LADRASRRQRHFALVNAVHAFRKEQGSRGATRAASSPCDNPRQLRPEMPLGPREPDHSTRSRVHITALQRIEEGCGDSSAHRSQKQERRRRFSTQGDALGVFLWADSGLRGYPRETDTQPQARSVRRRITLRAERTRRCARGAGAGPPASRSYIVFLARVTAFLWTRTPCFMPL
jgi:hypothetical protein